MINFIENLYVTDKTKKRASKIIKAINNNKRLYRGFIIILSLAEDDVFDIVPGFTFKGLIENDIDIKVLGFAENRKAALKLGAKMSSEYIKSGENTSMREYFESM